MYFTQNQSILCSAKSYIIWDENSNSSPIYHYFVDGAISCEKVAVGRWGAVCIGSFTSKSSSFVCGWGKITLFTITSLTEICANNLCQYSSIKRHVGHLKVSLRTKD